MLLVCWISVISHRSHMGSGSTVPSDSVILLPGSVRTELNRLPGGTILLPGGRILLPEGGGGVIYERVISLKALIEAVSIGYMSVPILLTLLLYYFLVPGVLLMSFDFLKCNFRLDHCLFVVEGAEIERCRKDALHGQLGTYSGADHTSTIGEGDCEQTSPFGIVDHLH